MLRWWDGKGWGGQTQPMAGSTPGPQQPYPGEEYGYTPLPAQGPRRSWAGRHKVATAVISALALFILLIVIGAAAGSHSSGGRAPAQAAAPSSSPAASTAATAGICTTGACIVSDAQTGLIGSVAKDESVLTKMRCHASSVKHNPGNTWTVACLATFSDGSQSAGYVNLLPSANKITFEPAN